MSARIPAHEDDAPLASALAAESGLAHCWRCDGRGYDELGPVGQVECSTCLGLGILNENEIGEPVPERAS